MCDSSCMEYRCEGNIHLFMKLRQTDCTEVTVREFKETYSLLLFATDDAIYPLDESEFQLAASAHA